MDQHQDKKGFFCFGAWWTLSAVSEMSKIGPRPLLDSLIRLDDGCYELCRIYIDIQFGQIPMTAVAVQQYRPAMDSCMDGIRSYRLGALTAVKRTVGV